MFSITVLPSSPSSSSILGLGLNSITVPKFVCSYSFPHFPVVIKSRVVVLAKKQRNSHSEPVVLKPTILEIEQQEQEQEEEEDDILLDEELVTEDGFFDDDYFEEEAEAYVGDGGEGGGISLAGTSWDKEVLAIAEDVCLSFEGDLKIYAFKTLANSTIRVRIEKLSNKSGSPGMTDIEAFSSAYRARLEKVELAGSIPENVSLEVSSPGVERIVRVPEDLERFKDRAMYVKYAVETSLTDSSTENDGILRLVSFDLETNSCTWGIADVRANREKAGKGRPLNKKQREWRLITPFDSLLLVRIYSEC